jgi:hypothetical protein
MNLFPLRNQQEPIESLKIHKKEMNEKMEETKKSFTMVSETTKYYTDDIQNMRSKSNLLDLTSSNIRRQESVLRSTQGIAEEVAQHFKMIDELVDILK